MKKIRILLADDHKIVLEGIRNILEPEFDLVGMVENGRALVKACEEMSPDVVIVDISMPQLNGIEATKQIKRIDDSIQIIFLTMHMDVTYAARAFEAGASGYVLKHSAADELITAIHEVIKGRTYVTPMIAGELLQSYQNGALGKKRMKQKLTNRQMEVLQLWAEGSSAKEVANILSVSPRTVEFHKYTMMDELGIKSSAGLVQYAIKHGIVTI